MCYALSQRPTRHMMRRVGPCSTPRATITHSPHASTTHTIAPSLDPEDHADAIDTRWRSDLHQRLRPADNPQAFSILNTLVLQMGQTPRVAGLRFLSITRLGFLISTFFLHFIQ